MSIKASSQVSLVDITDAYSVTLTSEAFTFVGNTNGAPAGLSCTTQAVAYCGTTQCSKVSISTVTCPSGISATISNNNTASPTITFKTTATITAACEATIPVVVDGVTVNKKFSFAVAKQGKSGADDINIGGRNLLKNSNKIYLTGSDQPANSTRDNGKITIINDKNWNAYTWVQSFHTKSVAEISKEIGKSYTFSGEIKTTNLTKSGLKLEYDLRNSSGVFVKATGSISPNNNGVWQKIYGTLLVPNQTLEAVSSLICITSSGTTGYNGVIIEYRNFKLEKGNKATDWTPAPEDQVSKGEVVDQVNSELKIEGNSIDLTTGHFTINSKNMTLDEDGNATFSGAVKGSVIEGSTITGASGNFTKGFKVETDVPTSFGTTGKQSIIAEGGVTSIGFHLDGEDTVGSADNMIKITPEGVSIGASGWYRGASVDINSMAGIGFTSGGFGDFVFSGGDVQVKDSLIVQSGSNTGLQMWSDGEGGNIRFNTPNKSGFWEMDAYNSTSFRIFHNNGSGYDCFYSFPSNGWLQSPNVTLNNGNLHFYRNGTCYSQMGILDSGNPSWYSQNHIQVFPQNGGGNGWFACTGNFVYSNSCFQFSARKYKKNIVNITEEAAEKLLDVVPVEFDYKNSGAHSSGFIADDTEELFPHLIQYDDDDNINGLNYIGFIPYIVKKIQMQQKEINEQQKEINELKEQVNKLMSVCGLS